MDLDDRKRQLEDEIDLIDKKIKYYEHRAAKLNKDIEHNKFYLPAIIFSALPFVVYYLSYYLESCPYLSSGFNEAYSDFINNSSIDGHVAITTVSGIIFVPTGIVLSIVSYIEKLKGKDELCKIENTIDSNQKKIGKLLTRIGEINQVKNKERREK